MWCGLLTEAGEIIGIGRRKLERTDRTSDDGKPIYLAMWNEVGVTIHGGTLIYAGVYTEEKGGVFLGMSEWKHRPPDTILKTSGITVWFPIRLKEEI